MGIEETKRWGIMQQPVAKWDKRIEEWYYISSIFR